MAQNAISDNLNFKNFLGRASPRPPSMGCLQEQVAFINYIILSLDYCQINPKLLLTPLICVYQIIIQLYP